jgi:hypothetical protein
LKKFCQAFFQKKLFFLKKCNLSSKHLFYPGEHAPHRRASRHLNTPQEKLFRKEGLYTGRLGGLLPFQMIRQVKKTGFPFQVTPDILQPFFNAVKAGYKALRQIVDALVKAFFHVINAPVKAVNLGLKVVYADIYIPGYYFLHRLLDYSEQKMPHSHDYQYTPYETKRQQARRAYTAGMRR